MTDHEMLSAMSEMTESLRKSMREEMTEMAKVLRSEMSEMKESLRGEMSEMIEPIKEDLQEIKTRVKKVELTQENEILPRLNTIESCYTSTFERYKNSVDDYETMKQDVSILKKVVADHSEKLQKIG